MADLSGQVEDNVHTLHDFPQRTGVPEVNDVRADGPSDIIEVPGVAPAAWIERIHDPDLRPAERGEEVHEVTSNKSQSSRDQDCKFVVFAQALFNHWAQPQA